MGWALLCGFAESAGEEGAGGGEDQPVGQQDSDNQLVATKYNHELPKEDDLHGHGDKPQQKKGNIVSVVLFHGLLLSIFVWTLSSDKIMKKHIVMIPIVLLMFGSADCSSQDKPGEAQKVNRRPVVAGRFYPSDPGELDSMLSSCFSNASKKQVEEVVAIISPHAGYVYSGEVAASAYNQLDENKTYDNVFILASSHQVAFKGASIYNKGDYLTPLGKVEVNIELANKIIESNTAFSFNPEADRNEHSVEVQVPFLQYRLKKPFKLVPIVLGTQSAHGCKKIAEGLKPYFGGNNLFVISTDFSHYPTYQDALKVDGMMAESVLHNKAYSLLEAISKSRKQHIPNLATGMCGWTSVLTLLYMTETNPDIKYHAIKYQNSGDSRYGSKAEVVGYWALAVSLKQQSGQAGFSLSQQDKDQLLMIARKTVESYVKDKKIPSFRTNEFSENLHTKTGAFVTLHMKGKLRGCIGRFQPNEPLYQVVIRMAKAAATEDTRFFPVTSKELDQIDIEISVLTPLKKIASIDEIVLGKHGIYIKKGYASGTFLPQVATETGWTLEEFLGHCADDKAGIGWDGWKNADIFTYEALIFSEKE